MSELTGVMQILLYTDTTRYEDMESFYRDLLLEDPYYSWYESESDRGVYAKCPECIFEKISTRPYGTRFFSILDPMGNKVSIYMNGH